MAEWLFEDGIGERRAALLADGRLVEMVVEWDGDPVPRAGAIVAARLVRRPDASGRGLVRLADGADAHLAPVPAGLTEGAGIVVEIVREAVREAALVKPPRARPADPDRAPADGPDLLARLAASGHPVRAVSGASDRLEAAGWDEAVEMAASGVVVLPGLTLRITPTPAMTLIDVDGVGAPAALAVAGVRAAGEAIRRFGIAGSIGIDLPTLAGKADRLAAAAALDAVLPPPFERTAVNGFGFLQIVRRRRRASLVERFAFDPVGAAARALLRRGERARGKGALILHAHPAVAAAFAARPDWLAMLAARTGTAVDLREDAALAISAGYAANRHP